MDEILRLHKYIKEFDLNSESEFKLEFDAFGHQANEVINSYYDQECEEWIFDYSLISTLIHLGYTPDYISRNLNWFFFENSYFYCPFFDDLMYSGNYLLGNFMESDGRKYLGHIGAEAYYQADLKTWVEQRFKNAIEGL